LQQSQFVEGKKHQTPEKNPPSMPKAQTSAEGRSSAPNRPHGPPHPHVCIVSADRLGVVLRDGDQALRIYRAEERRQRVSAGRTPKGGMMDHYGREEDEEWHARESTDAAGVCLC